MWISTWIKDKFGFLLTCCEKMMLENRGGVNKQLQGCVSYIYFLYIGSLSTQ